MALIAKEVGVPAAVKLGLAYSGCSLWIPRKGLDKVLKRIIIAAYRKGIAIRDIAIGLKRSMRYVQGVIREQKILAKDSAEDYQL